LNLASALIKQVIELQDFDTWTCIRQNYLPTEYHKLFEVITKHCNEYHELPTFEDLKLSIRDITTKEKLYAVETVEVDAEAVQILDYLKNEHVQKEVLKRLEIFIDESVAFENAEEVLEHLHDIIVEVESEVDLEDAQETMQRINMFEAEEDYDRQIVLGLNSEFDALQKIGNKDLILIGGFRGSGKSLICQNTAVNKFNEGRSSVTFSTEMDKREVLRNMCSIATGIDATRLAMRNLSVTEWETIAAWWASRFLESEEVLNEYRNHRDFSKFHSKLISSHELLPACQLDIVYDPMLTIGKIHAEMDKKMKSSMDISVIIVDYLNKVKLTTVPSKRGAFDWVEQIEIATKLKEIATTFEVPVLAPFQSKEDGGISFSKGILIDANAAYILKVSKGDNPTMKFECIKKRSGAEVDFTSVMNWNSLKIGPETGIHPDDMPEVGDEDLKTGESSEDAPWD